MRTGGQYEWLRDPKNGWVDVTDTIQSNADARPGDIIITRGKGHVILFLGEVDGFDSVMVSASYGHRSPMADKERDIMSYINGTHFSGKKYSVFRKGY